MYDAMSAGTFIKFLGDVFGGHWRRSEKVGCKKEGTKRKKYRKVYKYKKYVILEGYR